MRLTKEQYIARYGEEAWKEYSHNNYLKRKEKMAEYIRNHRELKREINRRYYAKHKETLRIKDRDYKAKHKDLANARWAEYWKTLSDEKKQSRYKRNRGYHKTKNGRATYLLHSYKKRDKNKGFECTLTKEWIMENIFTKKCIYCEDTDWRHLGADRIDNSKPHTPDNVVCACGICNIERQHRLLTVDEFKKYRQLHPRDFNINQLQIIKQVGDKAVICKTTRPQGAFNLDKLCQ